MMRHNSALFLSVVPKASNTIVEKSDEYKSSSQNPSQSEYTGQQQSEQTENKISDGSPHISTKRKNFLYRKAQTLISTGHNDNFMVFEIGPDEADESSKNINEQI